MTTEETREEIGVEDLKDLAKAMLEVTIRHLQETGCFTAGVALMRADRSVDAAPISGIAFENEHSKRALAGALKHMCEMLEARAVVVVSDAWSLEQTEEQQGRTMEPEFLALARKGGGPAVAAAGYGTLMEAVSIVGQTRGCIYTMEQKYQRVAADGVIPATAVEAARPLPDHEIRLYGTPFETSTIPGATPNTMRNVHGRMTAILYEGKPC